MTAPAKSPPLRPGDHEPQSYSEIQRARDAVDHEAQSSSKIPKLPPSSPWSSPSNWGGQELPLGENINAVPVCNGAGGQPRDQESNQ